MFRDFRTRYRRAFIGGARRTFGSIAFPQYLLYDAFTDTLAGGAVNGTSSTPPSGVQITGTAPTRTVVDANSKVGVGVGLQTTAIGAANNSGLWESSITRALGRTVIADLVQLENDTRIFFGFHTAQSSGNLQHGLTLINPASINTENGGGGQTLRAISSYTNQKWAVVLRTGGAYYFFKGDGLSQWTLLWALTAGSTATLYPGYYYPLGSGSSGPWTLDNLRIPVALYIPIPLAYDTFTRANGALGSTGTTGPDSQATPSLAWTGATYTVATNVAVGTPTVGADAIVNGAFAADTDWSKGTGWTIVAGTAVATAASADITATVAPLTTGAWYQTAFTQGGFGGGTVAVVLGTTVFPTHGANGTFTEVGRATSTAFALRGVGLTDTIDNVSASVLTLASMFASVAVSTQNVLIDINVTLSSGTSGLPAGLVLNLDSAGTPANFVIAYLDGNGNAKLEKCVAGTYTSVISATVTYSAGATIRVIKNGTSYSLFYNGAAVGSTSTISDVGVVGNTLHGLFSTSALNSLDNFQIFPVGTSNEFGGLDSL